MLYEVITSSKMKVLDIYSQYPITLVKGQGHTVTDSSGTEYVITSYSIHYTKLYELSDVSKFFSGKI